MLKTDKLIFLSGIRSHCNAMNINLANNAMLSVSVNVTMMSKCMCCYCELKHVYVETIYAY